MAAVLCRFNITTYQMHTLIYELNLIHTSDLHAVFQIKESFMKQSRP